MKKIGIHPSFFLFFVLLIFFGQGMLFLSYTFAVCLHEISHATVAKKLGYSLDKLFIMPFGACLKYHDSVFMPKDEFKIAIAGPLANLLLFFLTVSLWWLFPSTYAFTYLFAFANLTTFLFNLVPAFPLDGGRVLISLLSLKIERKKALKITKIINIILSIFLFVLFLFTFFFKINFSFAFMAIFLFIGVFDGEKSGEYDYYLKNFSKLKHMKNGQNIKCVIVKSDLPIYKICSHLSKFKFNIIYILFPNGKMKVLNEIQFELLLAKANPKASLSQFF
ncbi:MAG: site-2 protease family protein [Clostridia bacterium]